MDSTWKARELFALFKDSYSWRSKVVHDLRLAKLKEEKSRLLLVDLEQRVNRSLLAVLDNEPLTTTFDGEDREKYLDGLAFR